MKITGWYDGKIHKPVRKGVYQQTSGDCLGYQYWNGYWWGRFEITPESAFRNRKSQVCASHHNDNWRGLTQNPSKGKK